MEVIDFSHDWRMLSPDTLSGLSIVTGKLQYFTPEWAAGLARQHKPSLDEELLGILQRALMTSPEDRYPSAQALRDALSDGMSAHAPSFHAADRGQWLVWLRQESEGRRS